MAKSKVRLGSTHFFTLVVLSVAALGVLFTANFALQEKTQTQTDASNCYRAPTLVQTSQKITSTGTTYYFDVINNCPGYNQFKLRVKDTPPAPSGAAWGWNLNGCGVRVNDGCHIEGVHGKKQIYLYVLKPNWVKPGNTYQKFTIRAALRSNDSYYDERSVNFYAPLR